MSQYRCCQLAVLTFLFGCHGANSASGVNTTTSTGSGKASATGTGGTTASRSAGASTTTGKNGSANTDGSGGDGGTASRFPDCIPPDWQARCSNGWCEIPSGCFVMGSPEDEWGHAPIEEQQVPVTLTRSFEIGQHEVTQAEWTAAGYTNPSGLVSDGGDCADPDCPVGNVTWMEAVAYANLLSEQHDPPLAPCYVLNDCTGEPGEGLECASAEATQPTVYECEGYRLPADAEWEYAARAGTTTAFYSGDITIQPEDYSCYPDPNLEKIAWYCNNAHGLTHPVMSLEPNAWGLYDVLGNAYEWVNDESDGLPAISEVDPDGRVRERPSRNQRGGRASGWPTLCRAADQLEGSWNFRQPGIGFRLARTLPQP